MITIAPISNNINNLEYGEPINILMRLSAGGLRIVPSVVVPQKLFSFFIDKKECKDENFDILVNIVIDIARKELGSYLDIRASFDVTPLGFPEYIHIRNRPRIVKRTILELYSAWFDNKFRAFRIVQQLAEPSTYPAILIQNHVRNELTLVSREPITGARIKPADIYSNVDITVKSFKSGYSHFLKNIEKIAGFPVKVKFTDVPTLQVCCVQKDTMTVSGWLSAISSMKLEREISTLQTLRLIQPEMIAYFKGYNLILEPQKTIAKGRGYPVTSGYATGRILLPTDPLPQDHDFRIFVCNEDNPTHRNHIRASQGCLVAKGGGSTSHLGLILHGMGKAGVTRASDLNVTTNSIYFKGNIIPKQAFVYIDGNEGKYIFSLEPFKFDPQYEAGTDLKFLVSVQSYIHELVKDLNTFRLLSVQDQLHVANLIQAFKKLELKSNENTTY